MKGILALFLCLTLILCLSACASPAQPEATDPPAQVVNPVRTVDGPMDFTQYLGFYLPAPEGAEDCRYSVIFAKIAQIQFAYGQEEYTLRASRYDEDISGVHGPFEETETAVALDHRAGSCTVRIRYTTEGGALAEWSLFSMRYSLYCTQAADREAFSRFVTALVSDQLDEQLQSSQQQFSDMASDGHMEILSGGTVHSPYTAVVYSAFWDGEHMLCADGGVDVEALKLADMLPTIPYCEDFTVTFTNGGRLNNMIVYDAAMQRLDPPSELAGFADLEPGTYYVQLVITEDGDYIPEADETEYTGFACVFRLVVE